MQGEFDSEEYNNDGFDLNEAPESLRESIGRTLPRGRMTFEGVLGLLAAFFIGLPVPLLSGLAVGFALPAGASGLGALVFVVTGYLSILVVRLAARASEGDGEDERSSGRLVSTRRLGELEASTVGNSDEPSVVPLAIAMAIRLPNWPVLIRPWIGLWWLAHFGAAAFLGHHIAAHLVNRVNNANLWVGVPFTLLATFAFLFAGNLYLMLAVAACVRKPGVWLIVWRHRFLVDLILAAFLLFAAG